MSDMERDETVNHSTQTFKELDEKSRLDFLTLGNMFLHASYWYLALSVNARAINFPGFAWTLVENEKKCRDAALLIMNFVKDHGGKLEFADVARPKYDDSDISPEFICRRWDDIEDWLKNKITEMTNVYQTKSQSVQNLLSDLLSLVKKWNKSDN